MQAARPDHANVAAALVACAWVGNALYAFGAPGGDLKYWSSGFVAVAMILFTTIHALGTYGRRGTLQFIVIVFAVGWLAEMVSITTGVPFGRYHYTDAMAPFLGHVSVFVMPAYGLMGYICWSLGRLICGATGIEPSRALMLKVPLVAASLMVNWDLSLDPLRATVENRWIWIDGGSYFGVPLSNFVGWFLVTWLMFQTFAVVVSRTRADPVRQSGRDRPMWTGMALMYFAFPVEYLLNGILVAMGRSTGDIATDQIHVRIALVCALTMLPVTLYCIGRVPSATTAVVAGAAARDGARYARSDR